MSGIILVETIRQNSDALYLLYDSNLHLNQNTMYVFIANTKISLQLETISII